MGYLDVPPELIAFLDRYDAFFLMGHIDPDGDCIGAQMVMASFLRRRGKTAHLFSPGPFNRKEIRAYGGYFLDRVPAELSSWTAPPGTGSAAWPRTWRAGKLPWWTIIPRETRTSEISATSNPGRPA